MQSWKIDVSRKPAIIFYTDAKNRITASPPDQLMRRLLRDAPDGIIDSEKMLCEHGMSMQRWAPPQYREILNSLETNYFLVGRRLPGIRYSVQVIKQDPFNARFWAPLLLGIIGPGTLVWVKGQRRQFLNP